MKSFGTRFGSLVCLLGVGSGSQGCDAATRGSATSGHATVSDSTAADAGATGMAGAAEGGGVTGADGAYEGPPLSPACRGKVAPGATGPLPTFTKQILTQQAGSAYLHPTDLDGDGFPEFLLTTLSEGVDFFGGIPPLAHGGAYVLSRAGGPAMGDLGHWTSRKVFDKAARIGCPNGSALFDIDGDDVDDWVIGAGFLLKPTGKIVWMRGSAGGTFGLPQEISVPDSRCWYHVTLALDMDGDHDNDFVTSCHVGDTNDPSSGPSRVEWFENEGQGRFSPHAIGAGGGSLVTLRDLDGDGDEDVIAPQFFGPESMVWFEQTAAHGATWAKHVISDSTGRGFIVKLADMNGDGQSDLLYGNHNNEEAADAAGRTMGIYWFDIPGADVIAGLSNWDAYRHTVYEGFQVAGTGNAKSAGAPGMLNVGDLDGDCDMDVTASGDGDTGLYVFVQQAAGFEKVDLFRAANNENSGEQHLADLDGDGDLDIAWAVFGPAGASLSLDSHVYGFLQN